MFVQYVDFIHFSVLSESPIVTEVLVDPDPLLGGVVSELPAIVPTTATEDDDELPNPVAQDFDVDDDFIRVSGRKKSGELR